MSYSCKMKFADGGFTEGKNFNLEAALAANKQPITSTGGSSSYYDIPLPDDFLDVLIQRKAEGNLHIKTEEMIRYQFGNLFDFANSYKSLQRAYQTTLGGGKKGNDIAYELNKIDYSINKIRKQYT